MHLDEIIVLCWNSIMCISKGSVYKKLTLDECMFGAKPLPEPTMAWSVVLTNPDYAY